MDPQLVHSCFILKHEIGESKYHIRYSNYDKLIRSIAPPRLLHTQLLSVSMNNGMRTSSYCINIVVIIHSSFIKFKYNL